MDREVAAAASSGRALFVRRVVELLVDLVILLVLGFLGVMSASLISSEVTVELCLSAGFLLIGLRAAPQDMPRRLSCAWLALGLCLSIECLATTCQCDKHAHPMSTNLIWLGGIWARLTLDVCAGGAIAWIIRRWHPAKA